MKKDNTFRLLRSVLTFITLIFALGAGLYFVSLKEQELLFKGVVSLGITMASLLAFYILAMTLIGFFEHRAAGK